MAENNGRIEEVFFDDSIQQEPHPPLTANERRQDEAFWDAVSQKFFGSSKSNKQQLVLPNWVHPFFLRLHNLNPFFNGWHNIFAFAFAFDCRSM